MRRKRWRHLFLGQLLFLLLSGAGIAQDVVIVANRDVSISAISDAELHEIFTGARSTFSDKTRALPVLLKGGPAHEVFLHNHVGETTESFRAIWRKAVFTGQGAAPKEFISEEELLRYVNVTPGAIGYVSRLTGAEKVKVLTVHK